MNEAEKERHKDSVRTRIREGKEKENNNENIDCSSPHHKALHNPAVCTLGYYDSAYD